MNLQASSSTIRNWFKTNVQTPKSLTTQYDNKKPNAPENGIFCRFHIKPAAASQVSIGALSANRYRVPGLWIASLFELIENGDKDINDLADFIALKAITAPPGSGVTFRTPSINQVGRAGKYWLVNVTGEWFADKIT